MTPVWFAENNKRGTFYAVSKKAGRMHRVIGERMEISGLVDHVDGNGLNNCRDNLRPATASQNQQNAKRPAHNTSGVKGVSWCKTRGKWLAGIVLYPKKTKFLGYFDTLNEAAEARAAAERKYFGEYSYRRSSLPAQPAAQ